MRPTLSIMISQLDRLILTVILSLCTTQLFATPAEPLSGYRLPVLRDIPINLENYCSGLATTIQTSSQPIAAEAQLLCAGQSPTALFRSLVASPYQGVGAPQITTITNLETEATLTSTLTIGYALAIDKDPVATLLGEESHVLTPYQQGNLSINASFLPPPENPGDADTSFAIEQSTVVDDNVSFTDISKHRLSLYVLHPDNFKFFLAARTLQTPSEQFRKAVVLRAVFPNPTEQSTSLSVTILHFEMNSRDQHEEVVDTFMRFIESDMLTLYQAQQSDR